ncbi:Piwi domain-containing protein [Parasitella parasitica]|nr:Piwi domain-containing protein [Parasitella parasitica]
MLFISKTPTIIFGADVNHPAPGAENGPSVAALTASMDPHATKFGSCLRYQSGGTEMIPDLGRMTKKMLIRFYKRNRQKPKNITFYRDGASEGQFPAVIDYEEAAVKAACLSLEKDYAPKITFVVAQKRHHARFFPIKKDDADKNENCLPGTVIDTSIVHPFEFEFFLQYHFAVKGIARSSRYVVLHDDNIFSADAGAYLSIMLYIVTARGRLHCRSGDWSGNSINNDDAETQKASFAPVSASLQNNMYYM